MLTWKIVGASKVSVIYIYIYIYEIVIDISDYFDILQAFMI